MNKRKKKYNLNTSNTAHTYLMLRNLFTSLLLSGHVVTTDKRAKSLKRYAQAKFSEYAKQKSALEKKRWVKKNITTIKHQRKAFETLEKVLANGVKIRLHAVGFRKGDGALMYKVWYELQVKPAEESKQRVKKVQGEKQPTQSQKEEDNSKTNVTKE